MTDSFAKFIHLLYAPTNFCNMGCQYCYLGTGTDEVSETQSALDTLKTMVERSLAEGIVPFNLSFHGGEATAIPRHVLEELLAYTHAYYQQQGDRIRAAGFTLNPLHIKTNLYNFDKLVDLFERYQVSISGSVDLPLKMHERYRTDKRGQSTLPKILANLKLLARYPNHKKISCVVTREHMAYLPEFADDIRYLHDELGLDMSRFNVMFAFDSQKNTAKFDGKVQGTEMLSGEEQVAFYRFLNQAFQGTDLEPGLRKHWFKEFTPDFCCSAVNCGDKFFLLQSNGDVYACPRGQSSPSFKYGNIFDNRISEIIDRGWQTIEVLEQQRESSEDCYRCEFLPYCNQGCVYVREETGLVKSYTCELQKAIYRDNPEHYPPFDDEAIRRYSLKYRYRNNIQAIPATAITEQKNAYITPELYEEKNALAALIQQDATLQSLYSPENFILQVNDELYPMSSPILSTRRELAALSSESRIFLHVNSAIFDANSKDPVNNSLQLMLLRNTPVRYGEEGRTKQEHLVDYAIYRNSFTDLSQKQDTLCKHKIDLGPFFQLHQCLFKPGIRNNLYVTTRALRDYHYQKQKNNAFYHIQAINLPFPYLEFYWFSGT